MERLLTWLVLVVIGWAGPLGAQETALRSAFTSDALEKELQRMRSKDWGLRAAAAERIVAMGVPALPALAEEHHRAADLQIPGYQSLLGATRTLIGMECPDAVPRFVAELGHEHANVHLTARTALALASDECVPALEEALGSPEERVRELAIGALALHGQAALASTRILRRLLREDPAPRVRWRAAWALGMLGPSPEDVPVLAMGLDDPDPDTAFLCAWSLLRSDGASMDDLIRALPRRDLTSTVACWIAMSGEDPSRRLLTNIGADTNTDVTSMAIRIFGAQERKEPEFAKLVVDHLEHENEDVRIEALLALPRCIAPAMVPLAPIRAALHHPSDHVRLAAASTFRLLEKHGESLAPDVIEAWRGDWAEEHRNQFALKVVEGLPCSVDIAIAVLNAMAALEDAGQLAEGTMFLQQIGEVALPLVRERLAAPIPPAVRTSLAAALVEMGKGGLEELLHLSKSPEKEVRLSVVHMLGLPASDDQRVLARLERALDDHDERRLALSALEWQGTNGRDLLRRALRRFDELSSAERILLVRGLGKWDPDAPGLVEELSEGVNGPGPTAWTLACVGALGNGVKAIDRRRRALLSVIDSQFVSAEKSSADVLIACLIALQKLEVGQETVVTVRRLLSHSSTRVALFAAETLGKWGRHARSALPELAGRLRADDQFLSLSCARAIVRIGAGPELATTLAVNMETSNLARANMCIQALTDLGPVTRMILPELAYAALFQDYEDVWWGPDSREQDAPMRWKVEVPPEGFESKRKLACELLARHAKAFPQDHAEIRRILERVKDADRDPQRELCARLLAEMADR